MDTTATFYPTKIDIWTAYNYNKYIIVNFEEIVESIVFALILFKIQNVSFTKIYIKYRLRNGGYFVQGEMR